MVVWVTGCVKEVREDAPVWFEHLVTYALDTLRYDAFGIGDTGWAKEVRDREDTGELSASNAG